MNARVIFKWLCSLLSPVLSWRNEHCLLLSFLLQALHNDNMSLKAEIQNLQAQISDQVSCVPWLFVLQMKKTPVCLSFLFDTVFPDCPHADCIAAGFGPVPEEVGTCSECINRLLCKI